MRRTREDEEVERLLRLMGGMPADAYVDACEIIAEQPQHRTASHLVGHLAREIDSGLRKLLVATLPHDRQKYLQELPRDRPDSYDPPRREVIDEICAFLRVPEDADVRRAWRSIIGMIVPTVTRYGCRAYLTTGFSKAGMTSSMSF